MANKSKVPPFTVGERISAACILTLAALAQANASLMQIGLLGISARQLCIFMYVAGGIFVLLIVDRKNARKRRRKSDT